MVSGVWIQDWSNCRTASPREVKSPSALRSAPSLAPTGRPQSTHRDHVCLTSAQTDRRSTISQAVSSSSSFSGHVVNSKSWLNCLDPDPPQRGSSHQLEELAARDARQEANPAIGCRSRTRHPLKVESPSRDTDCHHLESQHTHHSAAANTSPSHMARM